MLLYVITVRVDTYNTRSVGEQAARNGMDQSGTSEEPGQGDKANSMDPTWAIQLQTSSCISERSHHLLGQFSLYCRYAGYYVNLSRNETPFGRTVSLQSSMRAFPVAFKMGVPALVVLFLGGYRKLDKTATLELGW